jgi:DUF4097 and DUF4098 domain-containing protein YvlB
MRHVFETPGAVSLRVSNPAGVVEIRASESTQTIVEVTAMNSGSEEAAEQTVVESRETGDGYRVTVEAPRGRLRLREASLDIRIQVPNGTRVDASTASANLTTEGALGKLTVKTASGEVTAERAEALDVKTASGDVEAGEVAGDATVSTASGDVHVEHVGGGGRFRLVSGDLIVGDARGSMHATTVSGDQELQAVERGELRFESVSGDVSIGVRRGVSVWMDVQTLSGSMKSDLEVGEHPGSDSGPTLELRGKTVSGDVIVRRAPARDTSSTSAS